MDVTTRARAELERGEGRGVTHLVPDAAAFDAPGAAP